MVSKKMWEKHLRQKEMEEKIQLEESKKMAIPLENETSLSQTKIWKMKGFKSLRKYQEQLARDKGFWSYESYRDTLAQQKEFEIEQQEHLVKEREIKFGPEIDKFEKKHREYCNAIDKIAPNLQNEINEKNTILMTMEDLAKKMGRKFKTKSIYFGAKYCLFDKGIVINSIKKDHEHVVIMRSRTPDDKLPNAVKKYLEGHL